MGKGVTKSLTRLAAIGLGATLLTLDAGGAAMAQGRSRVSSPSKDQKGDPLPVVFSADEVDYDQDLGITTARGSVEITQGQRTILADVVTYNEHTDTVAASGHVSMLQETGETVFANYVELTDSMRNGFLQDVRILMADRSRLVGNTGRRTGDGNRVELRKGIYTPCDLCKDDPSAPPLWDLRANSIVHNKELQNVEYDDVFLDIDGIPVLYSPYFSHPDPTVKRQSGFLPPTFGSSSTLGVIFKQPYYYVIDNDSDLTFAPMFTGQAGTLLEGEYRQRFANGEFSFLGSIVDASAGNGTTLDATTTTPNQLRYNVDSFGTFDIDQNLRAGFTVQRVSDQTFLELYKFGTSTPYLTSRGYLEDFEGRDYGVVNSYAFQSLQFGVSDKTQPIVLPSAEYTWAGAPQSWGGRFTTTVNGLDLLRETGSDSRRISLGTEFDLPFTMAGGQRFNFVAGLRGDAYNASDLQLTTNGPLTNASTGRLFPQVGLEWSYPWIRRTPDSSFIITPRAAVYAAPVGLNPSTIPNDDSQAVDFSETDLFTRNRAQGYDQVDSGQRVDYGLQADWSNNTGQSARLLVGQSYRLQRFSPLSTSGLSTQALATQALLAQTLATGAPTPVLSNAALNGTSDGLDRRLSDYVGRFSVTPGGTVDLSYRFRLDEQDLRPERQEAAISFGPSDLRVNASVLQLGPNLRDSEVESGFPAPGTAVERVELNLGLSVRFDQFWSASVSGTRELAGDGPALSTAAGLQYNDECLTFVATISQNGLRNQDIRPGTTVLFQLVLKNIGEIGIPALQLTPSTTG
jgi:LPS-assembly protein